jgi:uncharacterized protein YukJ
MAKTLSYGVLKGTVTGHLRDADDDHYQILVDAKGTMFRIAVNVQSSETPPDLKFQTPAVPAALTKALQALAPGFKKLPGQNDDLSQDFVRGGIVKQNNFKVVPGDIPGADNDLKDKLESAVVDAVDKAGSMVYAFGAKWGPETNKKDKYFKFLPGNGVHDIHMNQGNQGKFAKDDGVFQDGCLIFEYPGGKFRAFYMAFQGQSFDTDDKTGHTKTAGGPAPKPKKTTTKKKRTAKKKH